MVAFKRAAGPRSAPLHLQEAGAAGAHQSRSINGVQFQKLEEQIHGMPFYRRR